jgi:predicted GIY-YIG superfamily endonuclease
MANTITQTCTHCGETKPLDREHYHRNKGRTCGYMSLCKPCQMKKVEKYNRENPDYWEAYRIKRGDYIRDYWEDYYELDTCKIYGIVCKETGETYVGFTQHKDINIRVSRHKVDYRGRHGAYAKLHESVDRYGWDGHDVILIEELKTKDRARGMAQETFWIRHYHKMGKTLNIAKIK